MNVATLYTAMGSAEEAKATLAPVLGQFHELAKAKDFKKLAAFYDPDAVFVHAGKDVIYGREALVKSFGDFLASAGKLTRKTSDEQYSMCKDFIILTANYETETEKMGVLKEKFTQIWRKNNDNNISINTGITATLQIKFLSPEERTSRHIQYFVADNCKAGITRIFDLLSSPRCPEAKAILAPTLRQFHELAIAGDFDKVSLAAFYDPDAVLVHAGKDAVYGREALVKDAQEFLSRAGKLTPKTYEPHYGMCGDFIIMISDYETETEKMGVLNTKLTQIWRKSDDKYLLLHFEDARK